MTEPSVQSDNSRPDEKCAERIAAGAGKMNGAREPIFDDWISREDLAAELGLKVATLRRWGLARKGPPFAKVGRRVIYSREAVNDWLLSQQINTDPGRR